MSTRVNEDGVTILTKGLGDRRFSKGSVGARTEPRFDQGDVSLWKFEGGQRYTLFLSTDEAYDLADALDSLLDYLDGDEG